jgi:hypothetical protein
MISRSGAPRNGQFGDLSKIVSWMCGTASEQLDGWQEYKQLKIMGMDRDAR